MFMQLPYLPVERARLPTWVGVLPVGTVRIPRGKLLTNINKSHPYLSMNAILSHAQEFI